MGTTYHAALPKVLTLFHGSEYGRDHPFCLGKAARLGFRPKWGLREAGTFALVLCRSNGEGDVSRIVPGSSRLEVLGETLGPYGCW